MLLLGSLSPLRHPPTAVYLSNEPESVWRRAQAGMVSRGR